MTKKRSRPMRSPVPQTPPHPTVASNNCNGDTEGSPASHFDLFSPLLDHFVALPVDTVALLGAVPDMDDDGTPIPTTPPIPPTHRVVVMSSFVFPVTVSGYLRRVVLNHASATTPPPKRRRTESDETHANDGTLENVLETIRTAAMARLPPFANDSEFMAAQEAQYILSDWIMHATNIIGGNGQSQRVIAAAGLNLFLQCIPCLTTARQLFTEHIAYRLQRMPLPPRVLRVASKLKLQTHEVQALIYVLICQCGAIWPMSYHGTLTPAAVAFHNKLSSVQLMHFLADYREHIKQSMLTTDIKFKGNFMDSKLSMPQEVIAALSGDNLSEEQLIKLEKTALADVLLEERNLTGEGKSEKRERGHLLTNGSSPRHDAKHNDTMGESAEGSVSSVHVDEVLDSLDIDPALIQSGDEAAIERVVTERLGAMLASKGENGSRSVKNNNNTAETETETITETLPLGQDKKLDEKGDVMNNTIYAPYESDIEYMDESFKLLANLIRLRGAEGDMKDEDEMMYTPKNKVEATLREFKGRVRVASAIHRARVAATLREGKFLPRIEALSQKLKLSDLEKQIMLLLVGSGVSHDVLIAINGRYVMRDGQRVLTVGYILFILCGTLKERVAARKSFYQSSPLISNSVLSLSLVDNPGRTCFNTDLMDYVADVDRKIVDYLMGTETETAEMVPGSRLYMPSVPMQNVVLPQSTTELVLSTIQHYSLFEECKRVCGFGEGLGTGSTGLVFLFYGPSGTGKTMLANAVAHELQKRILLVNLLQLKSDVKAPDMMRFIFREARLNDAIIFFDECESLFESRESNPLITSILSEFEKCEGIIILATNKAQVIDEAMNRRISLMVEFKLPDPQMRERIWRSHLPKNLTLHEDVSIVSLALNYELSGGLIRNATLAALNKAVAREKSTTPTIHIRDLEDGARLQLRGFFLAAEKPPGATTESYHRPKRSLSELVLDKQTQQHLETVARLAKSRSTLFSQWGFDEEDCADQAALYLFHGPSGTGKSLAAEAIAYECGATIRLCNVAELLLIKGLKVHDVFEEGRKLGAIIVFDESQVLFNHSEQSAHIARLISYHAVHYTKPIIFIATSGGSDTGAASIDVRATQLAFQQEIVFRLPSQLLRRELWRRAIPEKMPLDKEMNLDKLSEEVVSAKVIRAAAFNACCRVAMLAPAERRLSTEMLLEEMETLLLKERSRRPQAVMFA